MTGAPLSGIRVIEAAGYVSGPFAGMMLADLGADVVKVEPPRGDPLRRFGFSFQGLGAIGLSVNHGKQSVVLDLKVEHDRGRLYDLLETADVFIENWRPGVAAALGFGAAEVCARYPDLVYTSVSGFGQTGPRLASPVFDSLMQASSGLAAYEAIDGRPTMLRSYMADKIVATYVVQGILGALLRRDRSGAGAKLDVAMLDAMAYFDFPDVCQQHTFLHPDACGDIELARTSMIRTRDGWIAVAPVSGSQVAAAMDAVGHPEWIATLKRTNSHAQFTDELYRLLESVTTEMTTAECEQMFREADVPAAAVLTIDEHLADPQTQHNELYTTVEGPAGLMRRVRYPARLDGERLPLTSVVQLPTEGS